MDQENDGRIDWIKKMTAGVDIKTATEWARAILKTKEGRGSVVPKDRNLARAFLQLLRLEEIKVDVFRCKLCGKMIDLSGPRKPGIEFKA